MRIQINNTNKEYPTIYVYTDECLIQKEIKLYSKESAIIEVLDIIKKNIEKKYFTYSDELTKVTNALKENDLVIIDIENNKTEIRCQK